MPHALHDAPAPTVRHALTEAAAFFDSELDPVGQAAAQVASALPFASIGQARRQST
jgi:hypothetical protein